MRSQHACGLMACHQEGDGRVGTERADFFFIFFLFFFFGDWAALSALRRVMGDGGAVRKADDETNAGG